MVMAELQQHKCKMLKVSENLGNNYFPLILLATVSHMAFGLQGDQTSQP